MSTAGFARPVPSAPLSLGLRSLDCQPGRTSTLASVNDYYLINQLQYYKGVLELNKRGFGFVKVDEDREFYIHDSNMKDALHNDTVLIEKIKSHGQREEGRVVRVLKRGKLRYVEN